MTTYNLEPAPFQIDASGFIYERDRSMLFAKMGSGKTLTYLLALLDWQDAQDIQRAMIVAPLRVCNTVWRQEAIKWNVPVEFALCTGEISKTARDDAMLRNKKAHLLVNYELLPKVIEADHGCDAIIFDELSRLRNPTGVRQKIARRGDFKIRSGGTGTPAPNGLTSIYGMAHAVGLGHLVGRNHDKWLRRYFYPTDYEQNNWEPFKETPDELANLIRPYTYVLDDNAVDLPPIVRPPIDVNLPRALRIKYDEIRATSKLSDEQIIADTAGVVRMKLRQILSGFVYDNAGEPIELADDYRLRILKDIVAEQQGQPIILAYEFRMQLELMRREWPRMPWIGGGSRNDDDTINRWNRGEISVLALHPASGGHGLNLQDGGCSMAWWQLPDDLEAYDQTIARLARRGQKSSHVWSYEPCALGTVDMAVRERAQQKGRVQDGLWKALKR